MWHVVVVVVVDRVGVCHNTNNPLCGLATEAEL